MYTLVFHNVAVVHINEVAVLTRGGGGGGYGHFARTEKSGHNNEVPELAG